MRRRRRKQLSDMKTSKLSIRQEKSAATYVFLPDVRREDLVRLVEVEDLDEREGELDLDGVGRVEERSGHAAGAPVALQHRLSQTALV